MQCLKIKLKLLISVRKIICLSSYHLNYHRHIINKRYITIVIIILIDFSSIRLKLSVKTIKKYGT